VHFPVPTELWRDCGCFCGVLELLREGLHSGWARVNVYILLPPQAVWLYEAITAARSKYYVDPRREARGWRVTPVIAAEQQVRHTRANST